MQNLIENTILSIGLAVTGTVAPLVAVNETRIPLLVMDCFQLLSYSGAFIIAMVTVYRFYRETKKGKK
jgi:uncharacterized membrane protein